MKLEMEGREPYIVLFGIPTITVAIVLGSFYLGRMQSDVSTMPPIYLEPKVSVSPRVTAEFPPGSIRADVQVPPAQIQQITREVVKVPDVNIVNKVEPTPIQVNVPANQSTAQTRFVVIPAPLPVPLTAASETASATPPVLQETALTTHPKLPSVVPPEKVEPTPVSTDGSTLVEPDVEGKLLPPPHDVGGQPKPQ